MALWEYFNSAGQDLRLDIFSEIYRLKFRFLILDNLVIHGRKLIVSGQLDYETEPLIALEINVTDSGNPVLSYQQSFNITVADGNDAPSDIAYTLNPVRENNTVEQVVANLRLVDEDRNQQIRSCLMISNPGYFVFNTDSINNVVHMLIKAIAPLDYETTPVINGMFHNNFLFMTNETRIILALRAQYFCENFV